LDNSQVTPARSARPRPAAVYERLRDLIVQGRLSPGTRLVELELAERLGVSRTPLRAALERLRQEGYVAGERTARQLRLVVAPLTAADAHELFHLVGALEGEAAEVAASLPKRERHVLADTLHEINEAFAQAAAAKRPGHQALFQLDYRFHASYVHASAGPRLRALHDAVKPQAERYERLYVTLLATAIGDSVKEHRRIIAAIRSGELIKAREATRTNWANAALRLTRVITATGQRGDW
jgi:DNA-binding GntR family transcriptional regulator